MIYCVWYPSGGFGHFVNSILTMYGKNFAKPANQKITFGIDGNAHDVELVAPKYFHEPETYNFKFNESLNYSVLIDNGMANEGLRFKSFFPDAQVIKICYVDTSWPIVARTVINKVQNKSIEQELQPDQGKWPRNQDWAQREKYFLYLRDFAPRSSWKPSNDVTNITIDQMLDYQQFRSALTSTGIEVDDFKETWTAWRHINKIYIDPVVQAQEIINHIKDNKNTTLDHVQDLWSQAVLYYFIWINFEQEVPHNDYADFFTCTDQIREWLKL